VILVVLSEFFDIGGVIASVVYLTTARPRLQKAGSSPPVITSQLPGLRQSQGSEVLASDADRDRVTRELRHHFERGRLTFDDMTNRLDVTLRAKTVGELSAVTKD
jgi:hypothetical protein